MSSQPHHKFKDVEEPEITDQSTQEGPQITVGSNSELDHQHHNHRPEIYEFNYPNELNRAPTSLHHHPMPTLNSFPQDFLFSQATISPPQFPSESNSNQPPSLDNPNSGQPHEQLNSAVESAEVPQRIVSQFFADDEDSRRTEIEQRINQEFAGYYFLLCVILVLLFPI